MNRSFFSRKGILVFGAKLFVGSGFCKVVVDTFAETRENDVVNLAQEMEFSMEDDQQLLKQIFSRTGMRHHCIRRCAGPSCLEINEQPLWTKNAFWKRMNNICNAFGLSVCYVISAMEPAYETGLTRTGMASSHWKSSCMERGPMQSFRAGPR